VNDAAQIVVVVAAIGVGGFLVLRRLARVRVWVRRRRRPETRSIRVFGVGGGGSNAVDRMVAAKIPGVSFVVCNTDAQALRRSRARTKIRIGASTTRGLGSGGDPDVGRRSAEEDEGKIARAVRGADLVFVTAGLGGGTGSGAAPIVAGNARVNGALTIAVVTKPFAFEGRQRGRIAEAVVAGLAANVDAIITVPNDRVADVVADDTSMLDAFRAVDDVLLQAVRSIVDLLSGPGLINLDFADVRTIMQDAGPALIGLGRGKGENRAIEAARQAIASPLLEGKVQGARGILFNVSGPPDLLLREVRLAAEEIKASADPDAYIIFGASLGRRSGGDVLVTLIATGLEPDIPETVSQATKLTAVGPGIDPRLANRTEPAPARTRVVEEAPALNEVPRVTVPPDEQDDLDVPSFLRQRMPPEAASLESVTGRTPRTD
jgi:cell division protein FtsZ